MITFERSEVFRKWLMELGDRKGRARILTRIDSASQGNFGDCKYIAEGVYEMRVHYGPGYRVYYKRGERSVYRLLAGGMKGTQASDVRRALKMARES
jgi:putative addiction module killer protein